MRLWVHYNKIFSKVKLFAPKSRFRQLFGKNCKIIYVNRNPKYALIFYISPYMLG